jgi:hypothetical protein
MKSRSLVRALPVIPLLLALWWHLSNRGLPTDDAANHAETSLRIAKQFVDHGLLSGVSALFNMRGWRPIVFPPLAVPFLLLTGNNVVAGCAAALLAIYCALTLYLYRLAYLLSGEPVAAAATCTFVLSMPMVISYSLVFFSESAWLLFCVACLYHLIVSGPFKSPGHAAAAGAWSGMMLAIRPVESILILAILLVFLGAPAIRSGVLEARSSLIVVGSCLVPATLLALSTWIRGITRIEIWGTCLLAVAVGMFAVGRPHRGFSSFVGALTSVCCLWWGGFMPAFYSWASVALDYAKTAQVSEMRSLEGVAQALQRQASQYGEVQLAGLAALVIYLIVSALLKRTNQATRTAAKPTVTPAWRLLYASSILVVLSAATYAGAGSDRRRSLVAIALFSVAVTVIAVRRSKVALTFVLGLIGVQVLVVGSVIAGTPVWAASNAFGVPAPHRTPDGNLDAARTLAHYVSHERSIAVYTLALFQANARIYEPNALKLACLQENCGFDVGYIWDAPGYDEAMARLRQAHFSYLLLDSFPEFAPSASREPYVHFALEMLRRMQAARVDTPGLRVIARFPIGGRDQTLFRLVPIGVSPASSANDARAVVSEQNANFPATNLNDGTDAAWGSLEGTSDVYAGVVLPSPLAVRQIQLRLFTPAGRAHLRDIRIVTADSESPRGPLWKFVRARLKGSQNFSSMVTVPLLPDDSVVAIEIDPKDAQWGPRSIWGFACLRSQGDLPNYLAVGSGVYVREVEFQ